LLQALALRIKSALRTLRVGSLTNSSWCICFTYPCGSRRKPSADKRNIVVDGIGGEVLSEALKALALGGSLTTLGYSASRKATIDVTDLIWKRAAIKN
jgi:hypothetical protein